MAYKESLEKQNTTLWKQTNLRRSISDIGSYLRRNIDRNLWENAGWIPKKTRKISAQNLLITSKHLR